MAALELQRLGYDVHIEYPGEKSRIDCDIYDNNVIACRYPEDADVMVFQRPTHRYLMQSISLIRAQGTAVVCELDDDLDTVDPNNPASYGLRKRFEQIKNPHTASYARQAMKDATYVVTSTPALLRKYAPHGRGEVIYNYVPRRYLDVQHEDSAVIGYGGSIFCHSADLTRLRGSLGRLMREGYETVTIGSLTGLDTLIDLPKLPRSLGTTAFEDWPSMITKIGVGVAPLAMSEFNTAKSWLKPLEYASVGVPCVMSPRVEYRRIHTLGIGILAEKPAEWYREVKHLADDAVYRQEMSAKGREIVREHLVLENHATRWWDAWTRAYDIQRESQTSKSETLKTCK